MKLLNLTAISIVGLSLMAVAPSRAVADSYVFGFTGGLASPTLSITTTSGIVTETSISTGWYDNTGFHSAVNTNYIAGTLGTTSYNDYFTFNLADLRGTVLSATLTALNPSEVNQPFYTLFDVSTPASILDANNSGAVGIFDDLGSGTMYGTHQVVAGDNGVNITISLDAAAIAAIQSAEGKGFSIGGTTSPIPEPSSLALAGTGLLGALRLMSRRRA